MGSLIHYLLAPYRSAKDLTLKLFWRLRTAGLFIYWKARSQALKTLWRMRATGFQTYWKIRGSFHQLFAPYWFVRNLALKTFWRLRAIGFQVYWKMRSFVHHLLLPYWFARNLALKTFWRLRAIAFLIYWRVRSLPHRLRLWLRNTYHKHLHKYPVVRWLRSWTRAINETLFKAKTRLIHRLKGRKYALATLDTYLADNGITAFNVDPGGEITIKGPRFIGDYDFSPIGDAEVRLAAPRLDVVHLRGATVMGGTNFVFKDGLAIHPEHYIPKRDVCPAELYGVAKLELEKDVISIYARKGKSFDRAVSLLGSCTGNYAHWLTETLPKLLLLDSSDEFSGYPLLVDEWIHPNFVASIALLDRNNRDLIRIPRWETAEVESLVEISPTAYVPPEYRYLLETDELEPPRSGDFPFSRTALNMLRDRTTAAAGDAYKNGPTKIFLHRARESSGNPRHVLNMDEIERRVTRHGYEMLDPAKLSFTEQVALFANVRKVVSPLGAALANLIFTRPGCQILGLSPYYENANYYYFSNFMGTLGHELYYVLGQQKDQGGHLLHKDYEIDLAALERALEFMDTH